MTKVAKTYSESYAPTDIQTSLKEALDLLGGLDKFVFPNDKVLIKPNMVEAIHPDKAVTVHPEVLRALIKELKKIDVQSIYVGDSPGYQTAKKVGEISGILAVCTEENIELIEFDTSKQFHNPEALLIKKLELTDIITNVDKIISLAKMKTHSFMGTSGTVKNLFGMVVGPAKAQFHLRLQKQMDFASMLIDIHDATKPILSIIDGVVGMEGAGPRNGNPKKTNLLIASSCAFAADEVMRATMGFNEKEIPLSQVAIKTHKVADWDKIEILGSASSLIYQFEPPPSFSKITDKFPEWLVSIAQKHLTSRPFVNKNCIACGRCAIHCPPSAIEIQKIAFINYKKCIRCYCCQEFCPADAISIVDSFTLKFMKFIKKFIK